MSYSRRISNKIIKLTFDYTVSVIKRFNQMDKYHTSLNSLREMPSETLGKAIADCLDTHKISFVPGFESHDLKHVLLGFKMTPEDEIRLQAFMIGNGNYSGPSFAIFIFGAVLLPSLWSTFYTDFKKGRRTKAISDWSIDQYAFRSLDELKIELKSSMKEETPLFEMKSVVKFCSAGAVLAGAFGMLFCFPFLFSSNIADLVGAGFPFLAGAVLIVGGLFTLSNLTKDERIDALKQKS